MMVTYFKLGRNEKDIIQSVTEATWKIFSELSQLDASQMLHH